MDTPPQVLHYGVMTPFARGSGGVISTAWDFAIFVQMLAGDGSYDGVRILEPGTARALTSSHTSMASDGTGHPADYGYGWFVDSTDGTFFHSGNSATYAWGNPHTGVVAVVLTDTPGYPPALRERFWSLVKEAVDAARP